MYALLVIVHIIVSSILVVTVLLQAGKGGGLSGLASGSSLQTAFGTDAGDVMKKATSVTAVVFMVTSLSLAFISAQRGASVVADIKPETTPDTPTKQQQAQPAQQGSIVKKKVVKIDPKTGKQVEVEEAVKDKSALSNKVKGMVEKLGEVTAPKGSGKQKKGIAEQKIEELPKSETKKDQTVPVKPVPTQE